MLKQYTGESKPDTSNTLLGSNLSVPVAVQSNAEATSLAVVAEHGMPLSCVPTLISLAKSLAKDQKASEILNSILKESQIKTPVKLEIIQVLIKCGIKCSKSDLLHCFSNKFTSDHERETLSMNLKERDESLAGICRSSVRGYLRVCCRGRSIYNSVQQLPIPKVLKEYITFDGDFKVF